MTARSVWTIGIGQCVSWGVLYYAFSVLLVPVEHDLGVARWLVTGAFSTALLVSAVAAPMIGRLTDRGRGPAVMQAGGLIAAGLLGLWALAPSLWLSYVVWSALGLCMASVLYEPVFAIVGRVIDDRTDRLRAIATITVLGGLASTIFLPLTAWMVEHFGWRITVFVLAAALAIVTIAVHAVAFRSDESRRIPIVVGPSESVDSHDSSAERHHSPVARLVMAFACSSFASSAIATNLVPALIERRLSATTAATLAGLLGVMQLPGRLLVMNGTFLSSPMHLVWSSLGLQITGLALFIAAKSLWPLVAGVSLFACGSGLVTLARPYLVLVLYGATEAGHINGVIARGQQLARSAGPVVVAFLATAAGYDVGFALLAGLLVVAATIALPLRAASNAPSGNLVRHSS